MDEDEWLATTNAIAMIEDGALTSGRKLRLFAAACCRRVWSHLRSPWNQKAVELAEDFADGHVRVRELDAVRAKAVPLQSSEGAVPVAEYVTEQDADAAGCALMLPVLRADAEATNSEQWDEVDADESAAQANLLRDIFGNPFHPVAFAPEWRTSTVVSLARQMYDEREFGPMPILADALQDAGCADETILSHCRGPGPHVRGCWVVDLVLGKE